MCTIAHSRLLNFCVQCRFQLLIHAS